MNRQFSDEDVQTASKYMKKCPKLLPIKETQIKMTMIFHLTSVRLAIKKTTTNAGKHVR
jgi:hypothetical protein